MALNKKKAVQAAKICLWAYDFDESREPELLTREGKAPLSDMEITDRSKIPTSSCGIVEYPDMIVVAFQGTITEFGRDGVFRFDSLVDWIQNFRIEQLKKDQTGLPGRVHEGFFKQLDLIYDQVTAALRTLPAKKLLLAGHSQGGAIATLATKRLAQDGFAVNETITFGAPRCGDATFARSVHSPVHRIEFGRDIVPHVPPLLNQSSVFDKGLFAISQLFDLPEALEALQKLVKRIGKHSYKSVGDLTYRAENGRLLTQVSAADERDLFGQRRKKLLTAGKRLLRHHGLDNYIAMLS